MFVEGATVGAVKKDQRFIKGTRLLFGRGGGERPGRTSPRITRQDGGTLKERTCCGESAPRLRARGRTFQIRGDVIIGQDGRLCPVPCAPIRVLLHVGRVSKRLVDFASFR